MCAGSECGVLIEKDAGVGNGSGPWRCGATLAGWTLVVRSRNIVRLDRRALRYLGIDADMLHWDISDYWFNAANS
jgi:hypothetical protein